MKITPAYLIETDDGVPLVTRKSREEAEAWLRARSSDVAKVEGERGYITQARKSKPSNPNWAWGGLRRKTKPDEETA